MFRSRCLPLTVVSCVFGAAVAGCGTSSSEPDTTTTETSSIPTYSTSLPAVTPQDAASRGSIVSSGPYQDLDVDAFPDGTSAVAFVYDSISGVDGEQTEVSGAVFVPPGPVPAGGRPVVAYAHGTVGIAPGCAPTETPDLSGDATVVSYFLDLGYAVAYTDYQGLSSTATSPPHPYLEPRTAGSNVIDSVRAARNLIPTLSTRWAAVGTSQGGQAAWAASELNDIYGDGLELVGTAVLAPALDVSPIVDDAQTSSLSQGQRALYPMIVEGLAAADPTIDPSDHLHGILGREADDLISCGPDSAQARLLADANAADGDTTASSVVAADALTSRLRQYSLPQSPSATPILAVYGSSDDTVRPAWTQAALGRACNYGNTIQQVQLAGQGHTVDSGALLGSWIDDRFAGLPPLNNC